MLTLWQVLEPQPDGPPSRLADFSPPVEVGRVVFDSLSFYSDRVIAHWHFRDQLPSDRKEELRAAVKLLRAVQPMEIVDESGVRARQRRAAGGLTTVEGEFRPALPDTAATITLLADGESKTIQLPG